MVRVAFPIFSCSFKIYKYFIVKTFHSIIYHHQKVKKKKKKLWHKSHWRSWSSRGSSMTDFSLGSSVIDLSLPPSLFLSHTLSLLLSLCHLLHHSVSLFNLLHHSLSPVVPLVYLFINDLLILQNILLWPYFIFEFFLIFFPLRFLSFLF